MNENMKGLFKLIESTSVRDFLRATPYPAGAQSSTIDTYLHSNTDVFFNEIYLPSKNEKEVFSDLDRRIINRHNQLILLYGYKGCGKTTFIHRYRRHLKEIKIRSIILNFDSYGNNDPIKHTITRHLCERINKDFIEKNGKVCKKWIELWKSKDNECFFSSIDLNGNFNSVLEKISFILLHQLKDSDRNKILEEIRSNIYNYMSVSEILILIVFIDFISRIVNQEEQKCVIVFDNLDVIYSSAQIEEFTRHCSQFLNDAQYIFRNISFEEQKNSGIFYNPMQDYCLIFVMRETTNTMFIEHFNDRNYIGHPINVSEIYDKAGIIRKRCEYVLSNKKINTKEDIAAQYNLIGDLLKDEYIKTYLFKLFNDDIRTGINAITEISFGKNYLKECLDLRDVKELDTKDTRFGSRGILFFEIFKLFANNKYFDIIKKTEYFYSTDYQILENNEEDDDDDTRKSIVLAINISRIILIYLFNSMRDFDDSDTSVQISKLYEDLSIMSHNDQGDKRDILEIINQSLIDLFNLRNSSFWNHLITFDGMGYEPINELSHQLDMFLASKYEFKNYGYVRITASGFMYLNTVLTHFEYYSARRERGECYTPLFLAENLISNTAGKYKFEKIVGIVWREVEECWKKLMNFYVEVFENKCNYTVNKYLGSKFVYHNNHDEFIQRPLFHIERVAHSHISYLDAFRMYAFWVLDNSEENIESILDKKKDINKKLVESINNYIRLISEGENVKSSYTSNNLIGNYKRCITKISNNGKWNDFCTRIDNATGNLLLEEQQ